ncbi:symmetrical bis(5'-nucleosyl)-tetraphosphatase [Kangiella sediminilitoris]|uniref:Bis(5'-nucleosyl)-tetraphosphatase, symmetrical n=1 Tax=Kangiella sediminilitoris TaxID=1144748 RepID=A0A1B3B803_9GAMM|nr:symmetrical bis(5'-nucleosyl)-tetraphosphatase [Kangiella sediminilitoris]AOE48924.1 Bis(5'-nucleosyl)-tetraphosphatase, symmetrical [Kangiella sediminilitoris]
MATYAIGDIQGCYDEFRLLLSKINFNPTHDRLWLAGDLVNRGPKSLEVLNYAYDHQDVMDIVLGNHDLHLLAVYYTEAKLPKKDDLNRILKADNCKTLMKWLRRQNLAVYDKSHDFLMTHAGVPPEWDLNLTLACAYELEEVLSAKDTAKDFFQHMYGNKPSHWDKKLKGIDRLRFITNALTRMRFCHQHGALDFKSKSTPGKQDKGLSPWYELSNIGQETRVVFGHWAALEGKANAKNIYAIDTGCVWGNKLTALRLEDQKRFHVKALRRWA